MRVVGFGMMALSLACLAGCTTDDPASSAQARPVTGSTAWFALPVPSGLRDPEIRPAASSQTIPKAILPADEKAAPEFEGTRIRMTVEAMIGFAQRMRAEGNQLWGRIAGFPSETRAAEWVGDQFKFAGLTSVEVQSFKANAEFWWPNAWEVKIAADARYGAGSKDVVLASAVPVARSVVPNDELTAGVVFAGEAGSVSTDGVAGKIAIQHTRPSTGAYSERAKVRDSATALINAGAVGVINWIEQAGNMHVYDFGGCGGPCFNIGGADGVFLTQAIAKAKEVDASEVKLTLKLRQEMKKDLQATNVIGRIQGQSDEVVVVNAHLDSWFDGAGDNADGVGVMLALAQHYAHAPQPARTLVFVGSGGHHSPGMNGPGNLVTMNAGLLKKTVLVINLEHLAQFQIDAVPAWRANAAEEPKNFGVSNMSPFLVSTVKAAAARYGFSIRPEVTNSVPGDLGGYAPLNVARIQGIHSGPLYHTSGDVIDSISNEGLTKAARFYAYIIDRALTADARQINPQ